MSGELITRISAHFETDTPIEYGKTKDGTTKWVSIGKSGGATIDMFFPNGATVDRLIEALTELRMAKD